MLYMFVICLVNVVMTLRKGGKLKFSFLKSNAGIGKVW